MENYSDSQFNNISTFYDNSEKSFNVEHTYDFPQIRPCIFLIFSVCAGLPALIWAFRFWLHRKTRSQISVFILILLINDIIQLFWSLCTLTQLQIQTRYRSWFPVFFMFWFLFSLCGFLLHQLVALEGVLTLKYLQRSAHIISLACCIRIGILVLVFSISIVLFYFLSPVVNAFILSFSLGTILVLAVTFIITCVAPPTAALRNMRSVFAVAMVTFVMLYLPFILVRCVDFFIMDVQISWFNTSVCLMSLRVISDPILCVLVCRENLRDVQTPKTHTQPNADETTG